MKTSFLGFGAGLCVCAAAGAASAEVLITEIMYDPRSDEMPPVKTEWVEVYNSGEEAVDLAGWYLADEDGQSAALPEGASLAPKQAVVLIPGDCSPEAFQAAWGSDVTAYPLDNWALRSGMSGLSNKPSAENEVLTLRKPDGTVADEVNFAAESPWPTGGRGGPSIYLLPTLLNTTANDDGSNWRWSEAGVAGARAATATELFDERDIGSPGVVATE